LRTGQIERADGCRTATNEDVQSAITHAIVSRQEVIAAGRDAGHEEQWPVARQAPGGGCDAEAIGHRGDGDGTRKCWKRAAVFDA
jgi:hypothetical protein